MNTVTINKDGMDTGSLDTTDAAVSAKRDALPSRRSLFTRATTAAAGFVTLLLLGTRTAHAEGETIAVGQEYTDATSTTGVTTTSGIGLAGASSDPAGAGVFGSSSAGGTGVTGVDVSATGTGKGVYAASTHGTALAVSGRVIFSRSGVTSIAKGFESVKVILAGVTTASMVLATLQSSEKSNSVAGVVPMANAFTIYLNSAAPVAMRVAWFVIN